jgi:uncharacterized membrane protein
MEYVLYAAWASDVNDNKVPDYDEDTYSIVYNGNGETGGNVPQTLSDLLSGITYSLDSNSGALVKTDCVFLGWSLSQTSTVTTQQEKADAHMITNVKLSDSDISGLTNGECPVYAVWAIDADGNGRPDYDNNEPVNKLYYITATSDSNSSVVPIGVSTVQRGGSITFAFSAVSGYHISSVTIDGVPIPQDQLSKGTYTFSNVMMNHSIDVKSEAGTPITYITLTIDVAEGKGHAEYRIGNGSFTVYTGTVTVPASSDITVRAVSDNGYSFSKWTDGTNTYETSDKSFGNVGVSMHLYLYFSENNETGGFAVLNMICAVIAIIAGIIAIIAGRNRFGKNDREKRSKTAVVLRIIAFVIGIISIAVFFLTEDIGLSAIPSDSWTLPMFVLLLATLILAFLSFRFDTPEDRP